MIWAQTTAGIIGDGGTMAWHIPEDFAHFKNTTMGATVIMGRKTWESLPAVSRPLPGRTNIVITRDPEFQAPGATVVTSPEQALQVADQDREIWIIGGGQIYAWFLPLATRIALTVVAADITGDTLAPALDAEQWRRDENKSVPSTHEFARSVKGLDYQINVYERVTPAP